MNQILLRCFTLLFLTSSSFGMESCHRKGNEYIEDWFKHFQEKMEHCDNSWDINIKDSIEDSAKMISMWKCKGRSGDFYVYSGDVGKEGKWQGTGKLEKTEEYTRRTVCVRFGLGVRAVEGTWRDGRLEGWARVSMMDGSWMVGRMREGVIQGVVGVYSRHGHLRAVLWMEDGAPAGSGWVRQRGGLLYVMFGDNGRLLDKMGWVKDGEGHTTHIGDYNSRQAVLKPNVEVHTSQIISGECFLKLNITAFESLGVETVVESPALVGRVVHVDTLVSWVSGRLHVGPAKVLAFNRVAKTGSGAIYRLLQLLHRQNHFNFDLARKEERYRMAKGGQREVAERIAAFDNTTAWIRHYNLLDVSVWGLPSPTWMNMVRHPVERVISHFYYCRSEFKVDQRRKYFPHLPQLSKDFLQKDYSSCVLSGDPECQYTDEPMDGDSEWGHKRQMMVFCGHAKVCRNIKSRTALAIAKNNVDKFYAVVGVTELWDESVEMLERMIPSFFSGAVLANQANREMIATQHANPHKAPVNKEVWEIVAKNLSVEIEFYNYCKNKLLKLYNDVVNKHK